MPRDRTAPGPEAAVTERVLTGIGPGGERFEIRLSVGRPRRTPEGDWRCVIAAGGLGDGQEEQRAPDPFQLLLRCFGRLQARVDAFLRAGGRILEAGDQAQVNVLKLFRPRP